jgi:hypothetical protein
MLDITVFLDYKSKEILFNSGVFTITVPDDFPNVQKKTERSSLIDNAFWFCPLQHLHYFNTLNLPKFCERISFKVVDAFSDFPIDFLLFHPESSYINNRANGPLSHNARVKIDLLIAEQGMERYLKYYRSKFQVGLGRNITVILKKH